MRRDLPLVALEEFLALPLVAALATCRRDGGVLLSPVWHRWRNGGFDVVTAPDDIKVRHLRRDARASIVVYEHEPPYRGIEIRTIAVLEELEGSDVLREIAVRYLGREAAEAYAAGSSDSILIRLDPGHLRAWDFADNF